MSSPLENLYHGFIKPLLVIPTFSVACFLLFVVFGFRGEQLLWLSGINAFLTFLSYWKFSDDSIIKSLLYLCFFNGVPLLVGLIVWLFWGANQHGSNGQAVSVIACVASWFLLLLMYTQDWKPGTSHEHLRGSRLISFEEAKENLKKLVRPNDTFLEWGGLKLPDYFAHNHFLVAGMTRSGKTTVINFMLKSIVPKIRPGSGTRALIYDAKNDLISTLEFLDKDVPKIILNPFDVRCSAWDVAKDITAPEDFGEIAQTLFPVPQQGDRHNFFDNAAANLLEGVLLSLYETLPGEWTLRDALLAMSSRKSLVELLARAPQHNAERIDSYFGKQSTSTDIVSTITNKLAPYKVIASYWHHAKTKFSLEEWSKSESILILAHSNRAEKALQALNRVIFKRLSQIILDYPESQAGKTWIILDELAKAGRLEGLDNILAKGRSKGISVIMAFQNLSPLQDVYGEKIADAITGEAANKAILRLDSPVTAQWAERTFGHEETLQTNVSRSESSSSQGGSTSYTVSSAEVVKPIVMASDFANIKPLDHRAGTGISGYFHTPGIGAYTCTMELDYILSQLGNLHTRDHALDFMKAPNDQGFLKPWSTDEYADLGLTPLEPGVHKHPPRPSDNDAAPDLTTDMDYV